MEANKMTGYMKDYYYIVTKDKGFWVFVREEKLGKVLRLQKLTEVDDEGVAIKIVRNLRDGKITEDIFKNVEL